jgi:hypothetical protein
LPLGRDRRQLLAALLAVLGCVVLLTGVPSRASAAALSGAVWTASSTISSATGVAYTFMMTPRTGAALTKVTMTVPAGTSGTPAVGTVLPSLPGGSAVSLSGTLLTYTFSSVSVPAGLDLSLQFTGLKNTATAGSYTSVITTYTGTTAIDTGTASFTFGGNAMTGTPSWTASSTVTGAASTYTYTFTPNNLLDGIAIGTITISVPPGTSGTPVVSASSPVLSTVNSVSLSGSTLTFSYSPGLLNILSAISITVTGLTNTFTAGSYVPEIVLSNGGGLIGTGEAPAVTFPGTLTLGAPATLTWAGTLNGQNQALAEAAAADQLMTVNDQTNSQGGWHVTVSATNFVTSGGGALPSAGVLTVNGSLTAAGATAAPTAACSGTAACTVPNTSAVTYPAVITSAASSPPATTVYSAQAGTGIGLVALGGSAAVNPLGWWVHVPGYAYSGSYSSTVTVTVISGP